MSVEVVPAAELVPEVVDVCREAFGQSPYSEAEAEVARVADGVLPHHASREDFRCAVAHDGADVVGAFELVELAVRPAARRRGSGSRPHDAVVVSLPHRTALLSTCDEDPPAPVVFTGLRLPPPA